MADEPTSQPEPRGAGRPSKLTPEVQRRICRHLRRGLGREESAEQAGIHPVTFRRWMAQGEKEEEGEYRSFRTAVEGAERTLIRRAAKVMTDLLAPTTSESVRFASAKFILERRAPHLYGAKAALALSGPTGGPVQVEAKVEAKVGPLFTDEQIREMTPEQIRAALIGLGREP